MLESTKDILFLVLAISIVFFTFFLCFFFYYLVKILKRMDQLVTEVKDRFEKLHKTVENGFNYLGIVSEGVKMAISYLMEKRGEKKEKKKK
jgi:hypothetical protein